MNSPLNEGQKNGLKEGEVVQENFLSKKSEEKVSKLSKWTQYCTAALLAITPSLYIAGNYVAGHPKTKEYVFPAEESQRGLKAQAVFMRLQNTAAMLRERKNNIRTKEDREKLLTDMRNYCTIITHIASRDTLEKNGSDVSTVLDSDITIEGIARELDPRLVDANENFVLTMHNGTTYEFRNALTELLAKEFYKYRSEIETGKPGAGSPFPTVEETQNSWTYAFKNYIYFFRNGDNRK